MADLTALFGGPFDAARHAARNDGPPDAEAEFLRVLDGAGLVIDGLESGRIVRCKTKNSKGKRPAFYFFEIDIPTGIGYGAYGDWREGGTIGRWSSYDENRYTLSEADRIALERRMELARARAEEARRQAHDKAAGLAERFVAECTAAPADFPYLKTKGIKPLNALYHPGRRTLVVPMYDVAGRVRSYQTIFENGTKDFLLDGEKQGCFFLIGDNFSEPTYLVEGFATGASVHQATGKAVVVAMDCGNLEPVYLALKDLTRVRLINAADNDHQKENNAGLTTAKKLKDKYGLEFVFPRGIEGNDFNDLHAERGIDAVRAALSDGEARIRYANTTVYKRPEPLDFVVDDFFVAGTSSMIYGEPAAKKSFLVQDIGMSIATGVPWHGREVQQGGVFYVCGEGHQDLHNRIFAWKTHHEIDKDAQFPFFHTEHEIDLLDQANLDHLIQFITELPNHEATPPIKFIAIDTLSTCFGGGDENAGDMAIFINGMNRMARETGAHVLVVHHIGKDASKGARGGSAAKGNVFTFLKAEANENGNTRLIMEKIKGAAQIKPLIFDFPVIDLGINPDHKGRELPTTSLVPVLDKDANEGAELAANLIAGAAQKLGRNQKYVLEVLFQMRAEILKNKPDETRFVIEKTTLFDQISTVINIASRRSEAVRGLVEKGILIDHSSKIFIFEYSNEINDL